MEISLQTSVYAYTNHSNVTLCLSTTNYCMLSTNVHTLSTAQMSHLHRALINRVMLLVDQDIACFLSARQLVSGIMDPKHCQDNHGAYKKGAKDRTKYNGGYVTICILIAVGRCW